MHDGNDLTALALVVLAALCCGMIMTRLRQPAVVGYILAGVLLGPSVFPVVERRDEISFLAELGVLMLLFFIGMEMSLVAFRAVWKTTVGATLLMIAISLLVMFGLAWAVDWPLPIAVLFGFVIALSSTAVVVKMLEQMNILRTPVATITIGVLIAQDLAVVPMMLVINTFGEGGFGWLDVVKIAGSIALLTGFILFFSRRQKLELPFSRLVAGNNDLTALAGLVFCFVGAAITGLLGLSPAFGAFLAGLIIGNSTVRSEMIHSTHTIQTVLLMMFFLSIGLLIDINYIWENLGTVIILLLFVTVLKTLLNVGILRLTGEPWPHAFIAGVLLAQIGEFSFVLGTAGVASKVITPEENNLIVAVAAFSLLFAPIWQTMVRRLLRVALVSVTSLEQVVRLIGGRVALSAFKRAEVSLSNARRKTHKFTDRLVDHHRRLAEERDSKKAGDGKPEPPSVTADTEPAPKKTAIKNSRKKKPPRPKKPKPGQDDA